MTSPKVLIVDDNEDGRLAVQVALRKSGYAFLEAENGEDGIALATEHIPDLIIMDVMMPGISGYEALRHIKMQEETRHIPVLIVTALGSMDEKITALEWGADGLWAKPFDRRMLLEEVEALIGLRSKKTLSQMPSSSQRGSIDRVLHRQSEELIRYYYTDAMTGLPNRGQLLKDLQKAENPGLLLMDIDGFKEIVYFYGHETGDSCLKAFIHRIATMSCMKPCGLYRISGDIFAILVGECRTLDELAETMERISQEMAHPPYLLCGEHEIPFRVTIGGAIFEPDLLIGAEKALKTAKKTGRETLLFDASSEEFRSYEQNMFWTKKIRDAITDERIVPYYQPIVNAGNDTVEKYECLVRLIDDGTVFAPIHFLEISKKSRYYSDLTKSVVQKAFVLFGDTHYEFSINLSARDMIDPEITEFIYEELEAFKGCERVVFELLESEGVENYGAVNAFIERVKAYGCKIAIDDFGSGYSNFIHLVKLKVDLIKIDGSLIRDLDSDANAQLVVETIVAFARKLGVRTVAEFVHSPDIYRIVRRLGVDYAQGYYLGAPQAGII